MFALNLHVCFNSNEFFVHTNSIKLSVDVKYYTSCVNSDTSAKLSCDIKSRIVIVKADFGRDKYSIACDDKYYDGNCTSRVDTEQELRRLCGNRQSCEVTPSLLVDPCPGVTKIFRAWYQCVGESM